MRNMAGWWRRNLKGKAAFYSFVPEPLRKNMGMELSKTVENALADAELTLKKLNATHDGLSKTDRELILDKMMRQEAELSWQLSAGKGIAPFEFFGLFPGLTTGDEELDDEDKKEIDNLYHAIKEAICSMERLPISGRLLKDTHWILTMSSRYEKKYPGMFRTSPNWMGAPGCSIKNATFIPPVPQDMIEAFSDLEKYINDESEISPLIRAALVHYQFETIHPFIDGNGRVGRILNTLFMIEQGVPGAQVLVLSKALKNHSAEYYHEIENVHRGVGYEHWIIFFLRMVKESAEYSAELLSSC